VRPAYAGETNALFTMQLTRHQTMKRASEFAMVRANGSSTAGRFLVLSTLPYTGEGAGAKESRFGIITTRKLGHAVVRVLLRRRVREILREHGDPLQYGHYVVIIPRHTAATASYQELEKDFQKLLKRKHFTS
jgi:ribonuclease P protein component